MQTAERPYDAQVSKIAESLEQSVANLKKTFPGWNSETVSRSLGIVSKLKGIFAQTENIADTEGGLEPIERQVLDQALIASERNVPAVVGSFTQRPIDTKTEHKPSADLLTALGYLQFLLVDFSDNFSEDHALDSLEAEDRFRRGMGLYRRIAAIVDREGFGLQTQQQEDGFKFSAALTTKLVAVEDIIKVSLNSLFDQGEEGSEVNDSARGLIAQTIMNYGACVELMHIPDGEARKKLFAELRAVNSGGNPDESRKDLATEFGIDFSGMPEWLENSDYGFLYFGSPLLAYAMIEAVANRDPHSNLQVELKGLKQKYSMVALLHTFLDGLADEELDGIESGKSPDSPAPNLYTLIGRGGVKGYPEDQSVEVFANYLLGEIKQQKNTLLQLVMRDLIKFYQLELASNSRKGDNEDGKLNAKQELLGRMLAILVD